jgi:hypothetical protein
MVLFMLDDTMTDRKTLSCGLLIPNCKDLETMIFHGSQVPAAIAITSSPSSNAEAVHVGRAWPRIAKITSTINTSIIFTDSALRGSLRQFRIELKCKGKGQTIVPADPLVLPEARNCFWHHIRRG